MEKIVLNGYINAARDALQEDPEYRHIFEEILVKERKAILEKGYEFSAHEYAINELRDIELNYILEHKAELDEQLRMKGAL